MFDKITPDDMILAFFPCTRFSPQAYFAFQGTSKNFKKWNEDQIVEYAMKHHDELNELYQLLSKLAMVAFRRNLKMIIENPYHAESYLTRYWPLKPKVIDKNRRDMGDYFTKPTQYFFINCEPSYNFIFEPLIVQEKRRINAKVNEGGQNSARDRSTIAPEYANRFIREYIL